MRSRFAILLFLFLPLAGFGGDFERDFAVVFITANTEVRYGQFPFDRSLLARAVERAADAGAKGVILKFFLDQSRTAEGDRRLAGALTRVPVLLQARLDDSEKAPNPLDMRFTLPDADFKVPVSGSGGWIPLPEFSRGAHGVCFVDFDSSPVPLVERYQGKMVKSLLVCAAELAIGRKAVARPAKDISIGPQTVLLDSLNRVSITLPPDPSLVSFDFNGLLDGTIPASVLRDRVVVIGYDGTNIPQMHSPIGTMGAHRLFVHMLKEFYQSMSPAKGGVTAVDNPAP